MTRSASQLRTDTLLHLSTAHLSSDVATALDDNSPAAPAWRQRISPLTRQYGWLLYVPDPAEFPENHSIDAFPQSLLDCFAAAQQMGAPWILFDRDEEAVDALPVYDW